MIETVNTTELTDDEVENVIALIGDITAAINDYARLTRHSRHPLEVGEVLSALFTVMVESARSSPTYDHNAFIETFTANLHRLPERPFDA